MEATAQQVRLPALSPLLNQAQILPPQALILTLQVLVTILLQAIQTAQVQQ